MKKKAKKKVAKSKEAYWVVFNGLGGMSYWKDPPRKRSQLHCCRVSAQELLEVVQEESPEAGPYRIAKLIEVK